MIIQEEVFAALLDDIQRKFEADLVKEGKEIPTNRDQYWGYGPKYEEDKPSLGEHMRAVLQIPESQRFSPRYLYALRNDLMNNRPIELKQKFYQTIYFKYLGYANLQDYLKRSSHFTGKNYRTATEAAPENGAQKQNRASGGGVFIANGSVYRMIIPGIEEGSVEQACFEVTDRDTVELERPGLPKLIMKLDAFTNRILWFKGDVEIGEPGITLVLTFDRESPFAIQGICTTILNGVQPQATKVLLLKEKNRDAFNVEIFNRREKKFWEINQKLGCTFSYYATEGVTIKCSAHTEAQEILAAQKQHRYDRLYHYATVGVLTLLEENKEDEETEDIVKSAKYQRLARVFFQKACLNGLIDFNWLDDLKERFSKQEMKNAQQQVDNYIKFIKTTFKEIYNPDNKPDNEEENPEAIPERVLV